CRSGRSRARSTPRPARRGESPRRRAPRLRRRCGRSSAAPTPPERRAELRPAASLRPPNFVAEPVEALAIESDAMIPPRVVGVGLLELQRLERQLASAIRVAERLLDAAERDVRRLEIGAGCPGALVL